MHNLLQIAVDGNTGSEKTTICRWLREMFGLFFVDSGTVYRFAAWMLLKKGLRDPAAVTAEDVAFVEEITLLGDGSLRWAGCVYTGEMVSTGETMKYVAFFSQLPFLREKISHLILEAVEGLPAVVNGRDIGTEVLPLAPVKIFLQASLEHRIRGWRSMLTDGAGNTDEEALNDLVSNAILRDSEDARRTLAPLKCPEDALYIETDKYTLGRRKRKILGYIQKKFPHAGERPVLTILIPTYNRAEILRRCLENLLAIPEKDLEFLVCDDCSSDHTLEVVRSFFDPRISLYANRRNAGASYNSHLCYLRARGEYALLISDEDDLDAAVVQTLVERFRREKDIAVYIAGGVRGENDIKFFPDREYPDGFGALAELGYCTRYMTGIVFRTQLYADVIGAVSWEQAPRVFSVYSFMYAMAELFFRGRVITSSQMLFHETRFTKTTLTNNAKDTPEIFYFEPEGRRAQIRCSVRSLAGLPIIRAQKRFMLYKIFFDTAKVTLRAFDPAYLPRYREMIPEHYDMFLSHLQGAEPETVVRMLFDTTAGEARRQGICTEEELLTRWQEEDSLRAYVLRRNAELKALLPGESPM